MPYHPAWRPGFVQQKREFTLVRASINTGIVRYAGRDGHHAATIARDVTPFLLGAEPAARYQREGFRARSSECRKRIR
jgi:hypothetical protein